MSIVLSAAVRQNLLSLQDTAAALATTQNNLSTGKKVNSALDNPTNFFTAAGLDNRAGDISNLLDGISNGVQVLQAANTGTTSIQSLLSQAKSITSQALQTSIGYSQKASISTTINGATASNLNGTSAGFVNSQAAGTGVLTGAGGGTTPATGTTQLGGAAGAVTGTAVTITTLATTSTNLNAIGSFPSYHVISLTDATNTTNGYNLNVEHFDPPGFFGSTYYVQTSGVGGTIGDVVAGLNYISGSSDWSFTNGHFVDAAADGLATGNAAAQTLATALGLGTLGSNWGAGTSFSDIVLSSAALSGSTALTALSSAPTTSTTLSVNGHSISFASGAAPGSIPGGSTKVGQIVTDGAGNSTVYLGSGSVGDLLNAVDLASGTQTVSTPGISGVLSGGGSSVSSGQVTIKSIANGTAVLQASSVFNALGLGSGTISVASATSASTLGTTITAGSTLTVDGKTISFVNGNAPSTGSVPGGSGLTGHLVTDGAGNSTVYLGNATLSDVATAIDLASGVQTATNSSGSASLATATGDTNSSILSSGALSLSTGTTSNLTITGTGNALAALGLNGQGATFAAALQGAAVASGQTLGFTSVGGGTATTITFGNGTGGTVRTLSQLNAALAANNLQATLDTSGTLTITTTNDAASATIGTPTGTAVSSTGIFYNKTPSAPVADASSQTARSTLVSQYNAILTQIDNTATDSSYNGVNLLAGDQLSLTFNETGKSKLNITGVNFSSAGLGLSTLTSGTAFIDNASSNAILSTLNKASSTLRSQASSFGSNLSVVQTRQDFNKILINVLQTGSANLTQADINLEAANSQALSTRQSLSVSALSLANQSQQSVLQLLR